MNDNKNGPVPQPNLLARRRSLFWRIHFWAALIASPFALLATLTGILYIFTPQVEAVLYGHLERVAPAGAMLSLDTTVAAAQAAAPAGMLVHSVAPPYAPDDALKVTFSPIGGQPAGFQCDWRRMVFHEGIEPPTWVIGDQVLASGAKGILFRSVITGGTNLVVYNDALSRDDAVEVYDPNHALPRDQASWI